MPPPKKRLVTEKQRDDITSALTDPLYYKPKFQVIVRRFGVNIRGVQSLYNRLLKTNIPLLTPNRSTFLVLPDELPAFISILRRNGGEELDVDIHDDEFLSVVVVLRKHEYKSGQKKVG